MGYMQAGPRSRHDTSKRFLKHAGMAVALAALVAACGGGGGDDGGGGGQVGTAPTPGTRAEMVVGDYFIYEQTQTAPVSASVPPYTYVHTTRSVAADGTFQRVMTSSTGSGAQQNTYNVNDALVSVDAAVGSAAVTCVYSPA